jgi:hypothetical protein
MFLIAETNFTDNAYADLDHNVFLILNEIFHGFE